MLLFGNISSCSEPKRTLVAGHYYTAPTEDGDDRLYFDDSQLGPIEVGAPAIVGIAKGYVASCEGGENGCYLFPADAVTAEAARNGRIGPLADVAACERKVFQLTGDSLRIRSLINP
jgi:hypothetical protein